MKMKTLVLLSLSLAVALALPLMPPGVEKSPVLTKENQLPLLGDSIPLQGHVEVENPAPQAILPSKEHQEKVAEEDLKQNMAELEVKVKPDEEQEVKAEPEAEAEVEKAGVVELEVKVKPEVKVEEKSEAQQEVKAKAEVALEAEAQMMNAEAGVNPEGKGDQELKVDPKFQVESEVKVEPDQLLMELEPEEKHVLDEKNYQEPMQLQADPGVEEEQEERVDKAEAAESHNDMADELEPLDDDNLFGDEMSKSELREEEKAAKAEFQSQDSVIEPEPEEEDEEDEVKNEMVDEPIMELEPLDDGNPVKPLPEEDLVKNEMENEPIMELEPLDDNSPVEPLPEEEELFMRKRDNVLDEEPVMELEPEMMEEPFHNPGILEEGPALDIMEQPVSLTQNYFPNADAKMAVMHEEQKPPQAEEEKSLMQLYGEPETKDQFEPDGGELTGVVSEEENQDLMEATQKNHDRFSLKQAKRATQGQRSCPGVVLGEKCYQFFKEPKTPANAELICQSFPGGHLASITSNHNHLELMKMILKENGRYTRTWIGGLRFLDTGRFIWLDGSKWNYSDWLPGEPNNTANKEHCLEVLPYGNGKFNDFTCWEPQAFICSYYD